MLRRQAFLAVNCFLIFQIQLIKSTKNAWSK